MILEETLAPKNPVLSRDPEKVPDGFLSSGDLPDDLDPTADGILMDHQLEWIYDESDLKIAEKGRRTGITFAEALNDTLIAAASRSAGGDNVFYIGDTKDKGREFIGYVAHFAKVISGELAQIEEFIFQDERPDGTSKDITAFRIRFASGFRIEALSSNPANIRGLQGIVVIDEAGFHQDVREVIDAVNALLIWGGKVRVISTHNGYLNPFNELVQEALAGKVPFNVHHIPFSKAVENGLYKRVCYMKGREWTQEGQDAWEALIRGAYGVRKAAMRQELDAVPADTAGAALTRVQIEKCMAKPDEVPIAKWICDDDFRDQSEEVRTKAALDWCEKELKPALARLDKGRPHFLGGDFARTGDATDFVIAQDGVDLVHRWKLVIELRNIPFDQQREILYYACDRIPRFSKGAFDKGGNGAYLAEKAAQKYGPTIVEVSFSREWYAREMIPYIEAFGDQTILLARHEDVLRDHQALTYENGVIKVPQNFRFKGSDGLDRHGDSAIAGALAFFASRQEISEYAYQGVPGTRSRWAKPDHDDDDEDKSSTRWGNAGGAW
ncbi:hypothetical protein [Roseobacter sp. TSBP12]|uniref:hypothetical protein n=1 Tax=Roseobacter sp. TSBP12 TaxID=1236613 RepID=UPI00125FC76F|nr:hypothetical protein [Roseobacter sp. TSBP12]KAB6715848.1 hypothetical protein C8029_13000 [Roseobacter sp. TSBP12]